MKLLREAREIEVLYQADVVVAGGGPAGIGAAVAAAREGKHTILLEKRAYLGGNITACYVENCNYFLKNTEFKAEGVYAEIEQRCREKYGTDNIRKGNPNAFNSEYLKVFLDEFVSEEGVQVFFHSFVNEVILNQDKDKIEAVIVQTKKGPAAIKAEVYVDTTGDADIAFGAGVPFEQGREKDGLCQPGTVNVRLAGADVEALSKDDGRLSEIGREYKEAYRAGETGLECKRQDLPFGRLTKGGQISYVNYACEYFLDPTDIADLTKGEMKCRQYIIELYQYLKTNYHELRNIEIASIAPEIGFRDSRRIIGEHYLTIEEMEQQKHFEDVIAVFPRFYDMLAPDAEMDGDGNVMGKGYKGHIFEPITDNRVFEIPYRSLLPVNMKNLLTAGRCLSADHVAESGVRAILLCMLTGEAAGTAAAISVEKKAGPKEICVKDLQKRLKEKNISLPE